MLVFGRCRRKKWGTEKEERANHAQRRIFKEPNRSIDRQMVKGEKNEEGCIMEHAVLFFRFAPFFLFVTLPPDGGGGGWPKKGKWTICTKKRRCSFIFSRTVARPLPYLASTSILAPTRLPWVGEFHTVIYYKHIFRRFRSIDLLWWAKHPLFLNATF